LFSAEDGTIDLPSLAIGSSVEKSFVGFIYASSTTTLDRILSCFITDHNGYFYTTNAYEFAGGFGLSIVGGEARQINSPSGSAPTIIASNSVYQSTQTSALNDLSLQQLQYSQINIGSIFGSQNGLVEAIFPVSNANALNDCATYIEGKVIDDNGEPISGALVVYEHGKFTYTDINGSIVIGTS